MSTGVVQEPASQVQAAAEAAAAATGQSSEVEETTGEPDQQSALRKKSLDWYHGHACRRGACHNTPVNINYTDIHLAGAELALQPAVSPPEHLLKPFIF